MSVLQGKVSIPYKVVSEHVHSGDNTNNGAEADGGENGSRAEERECSTGLDG